MTKPELIKHTWVAEDYYDHGKLYKDGINRCSVCNRYQNGYNESEYGCPEILYDFWDIGDRQRINFTEPTKVIEEEEWEPIKYPPNLKPHEQYAYKLFTKRVCIKRTIKLVRHGEVIEIIELPGYVINSDIAPLRVVSVGDKLDIKAITKEIDQLNVSDLSKEMEKTRAESQSKTPFLDLLESSTPEINTNDWQYRLHHEELPPIQVVKEI